MIYIAGPYYDSNQKVIDARMEVYYSYLAAFMKEGVHAVSPMLMHEVVKRHGLPNNFDFWDKYSFEMLSKCDKMYVIKLDGWDTSRGVAQEIRFCGTMNIPVEYINQ